MSSTIGRAIPKVVLLYAKEDDPRVFAKVVQVLQRLMLTPPLEATDECIDEKRPPAKRRRERSQPCRTSAGGRTGRDTSAPAPGRARMRMFRSISQRTPKASRRATNVRPRPRIGNSSWLPIRAQVGPITSPPSTNNLPGTRSGCPVRQPRAISFKGHCRTNEPSR